MPGYGAAGPVDIAGIGAAPAGWACGARWALASGACEGSGVGGAIAVTEAEAAWACAVATDGVGCSGMCRLAFVGALLAGGAAPDEAAEANGAKSSGSSNTKSSIRLVTAATVGVGGGAGAGVGPVAGGRPGGGAGGD